MKYKNGSLVIEDIQSPSPWEAISKMLTMFDCQL